MRTKQREMKSIMRIKVQVIISPLCFTEPRARTFTGIKNARSPSENLQSIKLS